jgi:hypothetical protein
MGTRQAACCMPAKIEARLQAENSSVPLMIELIK